MSLSLFANMEGLEGGAEGGGGGRGLGRRGESRSQSNCPTLDNRRSSAANERRRRRLSSGTAAAASVTCLLVALLSSPTAVSAANMMAENLREKMHTDYLSGDAGEHSAKATLGFNTVHPGCKDHGFVQQDLTSNYY